jgi:N-acetylglucosaminyldiphosphoundecaprenol N-acetyl-beta-D-mannosaminyltransferase
LRADSKQFRQILGVRFFVGSAQESVEHIKHGGLLVVPAAPALKDLPENREYCEALLGADIAITDSSLMVLLWNWINRDSIRRVSGLQYIKQLLKDKDVRRPGNTLWIMANPESAKTNLHWLHTQGFEISARHVYLAPMYSSQITDEQLLEKLCAHRYKHVIVTIGGGAQERLGLYIKRNLKYLPAIHCTGAAIAFLSGDQVRIPDWADHLGLGWLFRCFSRPGSYIPRYWAAWRLIPLMLRYRKDLPEPTWNIEVA